MFTPTCTLSVPADQTTCNDLASAYSLTVPQFVQLNDNVNSACSNLSVGEDVSFTLPPNIVIGRS